MTATPVVLTAEMADMAADILRDVALWRGKSALLMASTIAALEDCASCAVACIDTQTHWAAPNEPTMGMHDDFNAAVANSSDPWFGGWSDGYQAMRKAALPENKQDGFKPTP